MNDRIKDWLDFFSVCPRRVCNNVLQGLWDHLYWDGLLQVSKAVYEGTKAGLSTIDYIRKMKK